MKILYVSDLDGTLLNSNQELDDNVAKQLNLLIDNGVNFTVSTGRGNSTKYIPKETVLEIIQILNNFDSKTFEIQTLIENEVRRFAISKWSEKFDCLALNILHSSEKSMKLSKILSRIKGINFFIHKKVYSEGESFCDIVLENVSKASRLKKFKVQYGFDKVIAFGDSENDLPLLEVADEFYAVGNATESVKQKATKVIGKCSDNGVINFIMENSL